MGMGLSSVVPARFNRTPATPEAPRLDGASPGGEAGSVFGHVHAGRHTADIEGDFVVFLIGMRINKPWRVAEWWPTFVTMPRLLRELEREPDSPLLGYQLVLASPVSPIVIQYWRSFDELETYASDPGHGHLSALQGFFRRTGANGNVGIWHETYTVRAGEYEAIYENMPETGLARAGALRGLGSASKARDRLAGRT
jgi:hypothetical protein